MTDSMSRTVSTTAVCGVVLVLAGLSPASAAPSDANDRGVSAEHARVVEHWTPARRAAAIPRELRIDRATGQAFLRQADGSFAPYGRQVADGAGSMTPNAKPGGGGGGGGGGDATPPSISNMNPDGSVSIGAAYTFQAKVTDASALRSVKFNVRKGTSRAQSFTAGLSGTDTWTASLSGFSDGNWSWWVTATDAAGNSSTSATVNFVVDISGGGGGGGGTGVIANDPWTFGGDVQKAAGRIYFEMPTNAKRTRWAGYVCSGTVTSENTGGRAVIITAAHCVYDDANKAFARNVLFIPDQDGTTGAGTDRDCSNDPYGCWSPNFGVVDSDWTTRTFPDNIPWDYAYYVVSDTGRRSGKTTGGDALAEVVGSLPVSFAAPDVGATTHALGYSYSDDPNFMYCAENMGTEGEANWWLPNCGLSGGSSGGPWVQPMNTSTGSGNIISVNSWGYSTQPGMAGPKLNGTSALCIFNVAQSTTFESISTGDGNAGVAVGSITCP